MVVQGRCLLKKELNHTEYYWGALEEIAGKNFSFLEVSVPGDSILTITPKGLVDVNMRDVESFVRIPDTTTPFNITEMFSKYSEHMFRGDNVKKGCSRE